MDKTVNQLSWMIGGPQGSGVDSAATLFSRAVAEAGLWVFGNREYHSNIMGKHSYYRVRVGPRLLQSHEDPVHLLASFESTTLETHLWEVTERGAVLYDTKSKIPENFQNRPALKIPVDFSNIIAEVAREMKQEEGRLGILKNTVAVAASFALLDFPFEHLENGLKGLFRHKKKVVPLNVAAARKAYDAVAKEAVEKCAYQLREVRDVPKRLLVTGNHAVALGKVKAGCRFQTYYPISPASDESVYLESKPDYGVAVVQCEDEIAAIAMVNGAAVTGVRAATSTSGPGLSLMVEGIGWAGMNEVPVVVVNYQRGGPSTGLPTREEQGDLLFAIRAGHGEFPRLVVSPGDIEEYFFYTAEAFNYAERYQTPCILLCDKSLANATQTIPSFDESRVTVRRGDRLSGKRLAELSRNDGYHRFAITDDGISPRSVPGQRGGVYWMTGDEHNEHGHISEFPDNRLRMHEKRMKKLELAAREIPLDQQFTLHGDQEADLTIVSWGATKGAILDAIPCLAEKGVRANFLQLRLLWPFPAGAVENILRRAKMLVDIEMNYSGQLVSLVREQTGIAVPHRILKWTGRPISETEVVSAVLQVVKERTDKVVLTYGR